MAKAITLPLPALPTPPPEAADRLRGDQHRAADQQRAQIDEDAERTVVSQEPPLAAADGPELKKGAILLVLRDLAEPGGTRAVEERFLIREKLSSERNIAGDVYRAERYWDGKLYGDVVLKKPKSSLRGSAAEYQRVCRDLEREQRCLSRFERHPGLVSATGLPFLWEGELVLQTQYLPWALSEYLTYFDEETALTRALAGLACQCLSAIEHMAQSRDREGPEGYAHVDLKVTHLRMDHRQRDGRGVWVVVIIDLDSVLPVGPVGLSEAKFNRACVDPEKFLTLHDPDRLVTVDPGETVYALGLTILRVVAEGLGLLLEPRRIQPVGLATGPEGTMVTEPELLIREIERTREVDQRSLGATYRANRERRLRAGHRDRQVAGLEDLLDQESQLPRMVPAYSPPGWSLRPDFFLGLKECLRPRAERLEPGRLRALFAHLLQG